MAESILNWIGEYALVLEVFSLVLATAVAHYVARRLLDHLVKQSRLTSNRYDDALFAAVKGPLGFLVWVLGVTWTAQIIGSQTGAAIFAHVERVQDVGVIWVLAWFAVRFIREMELAVIQDVEQKNRLDAMTARAIAKILRVSVLVTGALLAMQALGFAISGVLAFGGIEIGRASCRERV